MQNPLTANDGIEFAANRVAQCSGHGCGRAHGAAIIAQAPRGVAENLRRMHSLRSTPTPNTKLQKRSTLAGTGSIPLMVLETVARTLLQAFWFQNSGRHNFCAT